jgi:predicted phosphoribosyltransferase
VRFADRSDAGRRLAAELETLRGRDVLVLGLPRGGVPVACEIARALEAPLDVFLVRKLGVPGHEELGFGAIASGGVRVLDPRVVRAARVDADTIDAVAERERRELERRESRYRGDRPPLDPSGRTVVLVDDGVATGSTMRAAIQALRDSGAVRIVVAVPVGPPETLEELARLADEVVCLHAPAAFRAVGAFYDDFAQVSDEEVCALLDAERV